ncbi:MAG: hypothetical protein IIX23_05080 [Oscillospiraceae bacterium]|nr:hypothetical protein [Oscillospiraceae bacterium]
MRDLEQAKAEVFRRGNARIKKRKAIRRSIIACCVPLVLCVGVFSVTVLPAMMPASSADSAESAVMDGTNFPASESDQEMVYGSSLKTASSGSKSAVIHVQGKDYSIPREDAKIIWDILKKLDYHPCRVCRCLPKCEFEIKSKCYGLHFGEGYARCDEGQARLTQEQLHAIQGVLSRNQIKIN